MCSDVVWDKELASNGTRFSSLKLRRLLASSATRGWNNNDLLLSVCGRGEGNGISGNTKIQIILTMILKNKRNSENFFILVILTVG